MAYKIKYQLIQGIQGHHASFFDKVRINRKMGSGLAILQNGMRNGDLQSGSHQEILS
jgi:hypothetical protein